MWLDRFSAHTTPAPSPPSSRPYSPAPRKSSLLAPPARPTFSQRSSSLSLAYNDSPLSLLAQSRKNNHGTKPATGEANADPVETLEKLIGPVTTKTQDRGEVGGPPDRLFSSTAGDEVDFGGLDLYEWAGTDDADSHDVHIYKSQTMEEYERDKEKFEGLHRSIRACDDVLKSVETNLASFQTDLGHVSAEIESLQGRSTALNVRLENRTVVERILGPIVEEISVSPAVVRKIAEGAIDEAWVRALAEVEKRSKALDSKSQERQSIKGVSDLRPLLQNLVDRALERIRDFLVAQIKGLRSPNINAQIIQQQHFLKYKDLYSFLHQHHPTLAEEISQAYQNTVRWYYLAQFTQYRAALDKLHVHVIDKTDLLGHQDEKKSSLLPSSGAAKTHAPPHDAFNLGRRHEILRHTNQPALTSYVASEDKNHHYLEFPFRHFHLALVDNAAAEYAFLTAFFAPALGLAAAGRHLSHIFEPTFRLAADVTRALTHDSLDGLGLLLCVRLNQQAAFELQRRRMPAMDAHINGTAMLLWPRFQSIMDLHCASLRTLTATLPPSAPSSAAPKLTKAQQAEATKLSAAPHVLTQRFAHFLHGLLALSTEAGDDEPVASSVARLRADVVALVRGLANRFREEAKRRRFLANNWGLVCTILGDVGGRLGVEQRRFFEELRRDVEEGL